MRKRAQCWVKKDSLNPLLISSDPEFSLFMFPGQRHLVLLSPENKPLVLCAGRRTAIQNRIRRSEEATLLLKQTFHLTFYFTFISIPTPSGATIPESLVGCRVNCFASKLLPLFFSASLAFERRRPVTNCSSAFLLSKCSCCSLLSDTSPCRFMLF